MKTELRSPEKGSLDYRIHLQIGRDVDELNKIFEKKHQSRHYSSFFRSEHTFFSHASLCA